MILRNKLYISFFLLFLFNILKIYNSNNLNNLINKKIKEKNNNINFLNVPSTITNIKPTSDTKIKTQTTIINSERTIKSQINTKLEIIEIKQNKIHEDKNKKNKKPNDLCECLRLTIWTCCCCGFCGRWKLVH